MPSPSPHPAAALDTHADPPAGRGGAELACRAIRSDELFNGAQELQIEHHGTVYRLRRTALGKLILTK